MKQQTSHRRRSAVDKKSLRPALRFGGLAHGRGGALEGSGEGTRALRDSVASGDDVRGVARGIRAIALRLSLESTREAAQVRARIACGTRDLTPQALDSTFEFSVLARTRRLTPSLDVPITLARRQLSANTRFFRVARSRHDRDDAARPQKPPRGNEAHARELITRGFMLACMPRTRRRRSGERSAAGDGLNSSAALARSKRARRVLEAAAITRRRPSSLTESQRLRGWIRREDQT